MTSAQCVLFAFVRVLYKLGHGSNAVSNLHSAGSDIALLLIDLWPEWLY